VLLTALGWALARWTGRERVSVELEGHGREEIVDGVDLSRTVGWFTSIYPVALHIDAGDAAELDWRRAVRSVRRQLREVPGNGIGYGALRYLGSPKTRQRLENGQHPQVVFNYLGQWDARPASAGEGLFRQVHGSLGQDHDPRYPGPHLVELTGAVQGGRLEFFCTHQLSTVDTLLADFGAALRAIAADCTD
jgi:non-ribosomal peptide synthase protein (TIGR01720 family)